MAWSPQQEQAIKAVKAWLRDRSSQVFYLAGFAGTGKTTLAKDLAGSVKGKVLFGAFTGKAAMVLQKKGCHGASTIHSMIYRADADEEGERGGADPRFVLNLMSEVRTAGLVVIDECSMVDEALGRDLLSFGTKVLVLGDPAQLPPVNGEGFFTSGAPDFMLTEVHRQAADNPIIRMSMTVREGGRLDYGDYGSSRVISHDQLGQKMVLGADQVLVGLNRTRETTNGKIRRLLGYEGTYPATGERLICLRNDKEKKLLNGGLWSAHKIKDADQLGISMLVRSEDFPSAAATSVYVLREFFTGHEKNVPWQKRRGTQEFTFGYAVTCHKAQGSQWDNVLIFDESATFREDAARWIYTAITRAAERVTIVK